MSVALCQARSFSGLASAVAALVTVGHGGFPFDCFSVAGPSNLPVRAVQAKCQNQRPEFWLFGGQIPATGGPSRASSALMQVAPKRAQIAASSASMCADEMHKNATARGNNYHPPQRLRSISEARQGTRAANRHCARRGSAHSAEGERETGAGGDSRRPLLSASAQAVARAHRAVSPHVARLFAAFVEEFAYCEHAPICRSRNRQREAGEEIGGPDWRHRTLAKPGSGGLEELLNPKCGEDAPHPFYFADVRERGDVIGFLRSLDTGK